MRLFIHESVTAGDLGLNVAPSLYREGTAMRSAIAEDFARISGVEVVAARATASHSLIIAPEFDDWLLRLSQEVLDHGGRLLGSLPEGIRLTGDKLATARHWQQLDIPHPATSLLGEGDLDPPFVLKPRTGAGSQATFLIRNYHETDDCIRAAQTEWPGEYIAQSFVPGRTASVALIVGPTQTIPLLPAWQHLSTDGRFRYLGGSLPIPEPLATRATQLALHAVQGIEGLQGYVGVDLVLGDDGNDFAIEINPRLTTSYLGLRQVCHDNLAELVWRCVLGQETKPPAWKAGEVQFDVGQAFKPDSISETSGQKA